MGASSSNQSIRKIDGILIKYLIPEENRLQIFGDKFVENNKENCQISVNGEIRELSTYLENLENMQITEDNKIEIILKYKNNVTNYANMFDNCSNLDSIYEGLKGNIYDFSIHKYASNVVERALTFGNEAQRQNIINEIIEQDDQMKECLLSMVKDKFGNYVVQKIIEYSDAETRKNIISRIISSQSLKKKDGFSKHVINFIEKLNSGNNGIKLDLTSTSNGGNEDSKNQNTKGVSPDDHHI